MPPRRQKKTVPRVKVEKIALEQVERWRGLERIKFWASDHAMQHVRLLQQQEVYPADVVLDSDLTFGACRCS